jgi:cytochrome c oxidase cbb3-type subunit IV
MDKGTYLGLISVIVMIAFFTACIWALLPAQKKRFDEAAQLPLDEEDKSKKENGQ